MKHVTRRRRERRGRVAGSRMGIVGTHPAVFVRVANKGVAGYGSWKKVPKMGDREIGGMGIGRCGGRQFKVESSRGKTEGARRAEKTDSVGLTGQTGVELLIH